jgi:hypothetical protein
MPVLDQREPREITGANRPNLNAQDIGNDILGFTVDVRVHEGDVVVRRNAVADRGCAVVTRPQRASTGRAATHPRAESRSSTR